MKFVTMSNKECNRFSVMTKLIQKTINGTEAAELIDLSIRQTKRLKAEVLKFGAQGLIHKGRGKTSNRKLPQETTDRVVSLITENYPDFGPTLALEKLSENHEIEIGKETLRQLMIEHKIWTPRPRRLKREYHSWRPRKKHFGELEQYDGCYHLWFENRAPECCLLAAIDDATGKITGLKFDQHEGVFPTFEFWRSYCLDNGKPQAIYLDKFSTYKINHPAAQDNSELKTQFQKAADALGIKLIFAHSAEAKGRVEKLFETLQDRLVKELRLNKINDIETANKFLIEKFIPMFNSKFAVVPVRRANYHKPLTKLEKRNLPQIFSIQSLRCVNNDFTIRFKNLWLQLSEIQPLTILKTDKVIIEERLDKTLAIRFKNKYLNFTILPKRPDKIVMRLPALTRTKSYWKPPASHPWRKQFFASKLTNSKCKV